MVLVGYRARGLDGASRSGSRTAATRDEWWATERRKLFVAMTRARDRLALVASEPLLTSIEGARDRFDEWDWP